MVHCQQQAQDRRRHTNHGKFQNNCTLASQTIGHCISGEETSTQHVIHQMSAGHGQCKTTISGIQLCSISLLWRRELVKAPNFTAMYSTTQN